MKHCWFLNINQEYQIQIISEIAAQTNIRSTIFTAISDHPENKTNDDNIKVYNLYHVCRGISNLNNQRQAVNWDFTSAYKFCAQYFHTFCLMCENFQINDGDFTAIHRHDLFVKLIKEVGDALVENKVCFVYCNDVPHNIYDYIIFLLCDFLNINFYCCRPMNFGKSRLLKNSLSIDQAINLSNVSNTPENGQENSINVQYMDWQYIILKSSPVGQFFKWLYTTLTRVISAGRLNIYSQNYIASTSLKVWPRKSQQVAPNFLKKLFSKLKSIFDIFFKRRYYQRVATSHLSDQKTITIFLNYQPEATTIPLAGVYASQLAYVFKAIDTFKPAGYRVLVKEHPTQFLIVNHSNTCRSSTFYDEILERGAELADLFLSADRLIEHSEIVVVSNGTAGIEALTAGLPIVCFGDAWFKSYPHIVNGEKSSEDILEFVEKRIDKRESLSREVKIYHDEFMESSIDFYPHTVIAKEDLGLAKTKFRYLMMRVFNER